MFLANLNPGSYMKTATLGLKLDWNISSTLVTVSYKFLQEVPSKLETQYKKFWLVFYPFDIVC